MKPFFVTASLMILLLAGSASRRDAFALCPNGTGECAWVDDWDEEDPLSPDDPHHCGMGCDPEQLEPEGEWDHVYGPSAVEGAHSQNSIESGYGVASHGCCEGMDPEEAGCTGAPGGEPSPAAAVDHVDPFFPSATAML